MKNLLSYVALLAPVIHQLLISKGLAAFTPLVDNLIAMIAPVAGGSALWLADSPKKK